MVWMDMCGHATSMRSVYSKHLELQCDERDEAKLEQAELDERDEAKRKPKRERADAREWEKRLEEWLTQRLVQPMLESALGRETAVLRCKLDELRVEIDGHLNIQDKLRQENMKLRSENDELRGDIRSLQL